MAEEGSLMAQMMRKVGDHHRYQKMVLLLFGVLWYQITIILLGASFVFMNPIFNCSFTDQIVEQAVACSRMSECSLINSYTIVGHLELYCDRQAERSVVQSALPIGSILGLLLMNTIADIKGRKWTILACLGFGLTGVIFTVVGSFADVIPLIFVAQILAGFGGYPVMIITYVVFYDTCSDKLRQKAMIIVNIVWGVTEMTFFIYDRWFNVWYIFLIVINIIPLVACIIFTFLFMVESPNYLLLIKRDYSAAAQSLLKIAQFNRKQSITEKQVQQMLEDYHTATKVFDQNGQEIIEVVTPLKNTIHLFKKLLGNWEYAKPVLLLTTIYIAGALIFYSIQYSLDDVGLDYSLDVVFLGFAETSGFVILQLAISRIERMRRVRGMGFFYILGGSIGLLFFIPAIQNNPYATTAMVTLVRFLTTFGYAFFAFLQTESFPSDIQSSGAGIIESLSQIGTFACPYILTALLDAQIYPLGVISAILIVFSIVPAIFLRQTRKLKPTSAEKKKQKEQRNKTKKKNKNQVKQNTLLQGQQQEATLQTLHKESLLSNESN